MGGEPREQPSGTEGGTGTGGTGHGSASVEDRLADVYQGRPSLDWRYLVVGIGLLVGWWVLFGPFSAFLAMMGLVALAVGLAPARTALAARGWPTTEAVVLESRVFTLRELRDSFGGLTTTGSTSGGYVPFVRYEYSVDGETYVNVRVSPFDGPIRRRRYAERIADSYEENTRVTVPYDPTDPSRSFLRTWTWSTRLLFFLVGSVVFLVPAIVLAADIPVGIPTAIAGDIPPVTFIFAFGGLFLLFGLRIMVKGLRTYRWPTTSGVVRGQDITSSTSSEGGSTSYSPKLRYEYDVDGTTYVSSRIAVGSGPSFSSRSGAREWLEAYPTDSEVTVHYNPRRPDRSVLQPGGVLGGLFLVVLAAAGLTVLMALTTGLPAPVERFLDRLPLERLLQRVLG